MTKKPADDDAIEITAEVLTHAMWIDAKRAGERPPKEIPLTVDDVVKIRELQRRAQSFDGIDALFHDDPEWKPIGRLFISPINRPAVERQGRAIGELLRTKNRNKEEGRILEAYACALARLSVPDLPAVIWQIWADRALSKIGRDKQAPALEGKARVVMKALEIKARENRTATEAELLEATRANGHSGLHINTVRAMRAELRDQWGWEG